MTKKETSSGQAAKLRKQAEEIARKKAAKSSENTEAMSPKEIRQTLHELRVHQIELDMQNEELRRSQVELDAAGARFFDLYDLAPVGYVTISENGFLLEANLTIATLLGEARSRLVKKLLFRFVLKEDQHIYFLQLKQIFETGEPQVCELRIVKKDGTTFWAQLDMIAAQDADGAPTCRIVMNNITERKQAEAHRDQQLVFARALNEIAETIISKDNSEDILENSNRIIGETLQLDRALIYDISFEKNILTGLCEWLKLKHPNIAPTKAEYPLDMFLSPFTEIKKTHKYLESQFNAVNAHFIKDGSGKILHEQMNIKSLIWYPFAFDEHGYYVFTLNQILEQRQWTREEIGFLESVAKQVTLALIKIKLLDERKHAEEALQRAHNELEQRVAERTEELRVSEEQYRLVVNNIPDIIYSINSEGNVIKVNSPAFERYGYSEQYVKGKPFLDFVHPEDREILINSFLKAIEDKRKVTTGLKFRIVAENGLSHWFELNAHARFDSNDCYTGEDGVLRDITVRNQAEESLREAYWKLDSIIEGTRVGTWEWNVQTGETVFNETWARIIGYTLAELAPISIKTWEMFCHPDDMRTSGELLERHFAEELPYYDYECRMRHKDGHWVWVHDRGRVITRTTDGKPLMMFGTHSDITERKQAEEALQESEFRLARAEKTAKMGNWKLMLNTKEFIGSPGAKIIYGVGGATISFDDARKCTLPEYIDVLNKGLTDLITKDIPYSLDIKICRPTDGKIIDIHSIAEYDKENNIVYGVIQDITEQKQAEADKAKLEAQYRQLQKTESLGRMAASIAHHFNNQLGAVIGYLEIAMDELPKGASTHQTLTKVMQSAWKAADMSGLMLTYLGQTHEKVEPLDLSYTCRKILPLIKTTLPGNVVMETDFPLPRPIIMANTGGIQQIFTNLLTNASEAVGNNTGSISLSVKTVSSAEISTVHRHPINWQPQGKDYACMEVIDTGCGIEDKDIEKLFDPFFSTKFTGRGMGLAVVLGLANSFKGVITVDSKPGRGSTFRIYLPLSEEALQQPQTAESDKDVTVSLPTPTKMEEGGTVLLIEDEEPLRKMVAIMLERMGFSVLEARDGIEALEIFGQHQNEIQFVLTDLTMPRMDGWETLTALHKLQPGIPVILASGYDLAHVMAGVHPELPQAFLAKPYNLKSLRTAISQALESKK